MNGNNIVVCRPDHPIHNNQGGGKRKSKNKKRRTINKTRSNKIK
jgi:hypothetical protein